MNPDTMAIRSRFPALERRQAGQEVAYFDGPGGTQVPLEVGEAVTRYLYHHNANTHWLYPSSVETDALLASARQTMADFLGAAPDEIAFGNNMTTLTFHLSRALGRGWEAGDTVIVTELDHHANIDPWKALESERGVRIRQVRLDLPSGRLNEDDLNDALDKGARLIAIGAASNALGTITDVAAVCARARDLGILTFVDAVHLVPHELVDVAAIGCDFLACSAYKFYGPHVGILFARRKILDSLDVPKLVPAPDSAPERIETGTLNHEGIVGAAAAVDFLASLGSGTGRREKLVDAFSRLRKTSESLFPTIWNGLNDIPGITCYGPEPGTPRTPTVAFTADNVSPSEMARRLAARGVFVSHGDFYAQTVIERLGVGPEGVVRAGCACYTSTGDVERLVEGVAAIMSGK